MTFEIIRRKGLHLPDADVLDWITADENLPRKEPVMLGGSVAVHLTEANSNAIEIGVTAFEDRKFVEIKLGGESDAVTVSIWLLRDNAHRFVQDIAKKLSAALAVA